MARPLDPEAYRELVRQALTEDIGAGDITTEAIVPEGQRARGAFLVKQPCVIAGLDIAFDAFRQLDPDVVAKAFKRDGERCAANDVIAKVAGSAHALLAAERVALNFLQRLSGIATKARQFVDAAGGRITVLDTRKTTPNLRALEKYAVEAGGATNHRMGLFDAFLIKDNHVRAAGGVKAAVDCARRHRRTSSQIIEVEAQSLQQVDEALDAGADIVLADNLSLDEIRETVQRARGRAKVEISGGVTLERMADLAGTGADYVSAGALTHSAPAADISFELESV
jgi:nicotinate-nucleotide pyrophosphorylase (carboxylating)